MPSLLDSLYGGDASQVQDAVQRNALLQSLGGLGIGLLQAAQPSPVRQNPFALGLTGALIGGNQAQLAPLNLAKDLSGIQSQQADVAYKQSEAAAKRMALAQSLLGWNQGADIFGGSRIDPNAFGMDNVILGPQDTAPSGPPQAAMPSATPMAPAAAPAAPAPMPPPVTATAGSLPPPPLNMTQIAAAGGAPPGVMPAQYQPPPQQAPQTAAPPQDPQARMRAIATKAVPWYSVEPDELFSVAGQLQGNLDPRSKAVGTEMAKFAQDMSTFRNQGGAFVADQSGNYHALVDPRWVKSQEDLKSAQARGEKLLTTNAAGVTVPQPGAVASQSEVAGAISGAQKRAEVQAGPANLTTIIGPDGTAKVFDTNRQAAEATAAAQVPGARIYNQTTLGEQGYWDAAKKMREDAVGAAPVIARQVQTLDVARTAVNDENLSTGKWQELSLPGRELLTSMGITSPEKVNAQQTLKNVTSRLMFQESPTLSIQTIRAQMLPYMEEVQGSVGHNPGALRAAILVGDRMAALEQQRISAVSGAPDPIKAQAQWATANQKAPPEFNAMYRSAIDPTKLEVPRYANYHDFMQNFYLPYKDYMTNGQRAAADKVLENFGKGMNLTGKSLSVK